MKRIKVQIEKETKKAVLVIDFEGRKGWIQKRWLAADSTVSQTTFKKAVDYINERQISEIEAREWSNSYHKILEIKRETEKALAIEVNFDAYNLERDFSRLIWIPKSIIKDMAVQGWFLAKKISEAAEELTEQIHTGIHCDYIPIADCERLF